MSSPRGALFPDALMQQIKSRFHHVDRDVDGRERLFFDNAGGSFRLKAAVDAYARVDALPDCPERIHARALDLQAIQSRGEDDVRTILNAQGGTVYASLTASGAMFDMVRAIMENVPGTNAVTTVLEHPSSYDAMTVYAERTGKTLRIAPSNPETGGVDVDAIVALVDADTALLSVMAASNISGAKFDIETIVARAREKKPDLFIVVDAVQHAPHGVIDLQRTPVDGINFAPYKFFGCRGSGMSWLSPRAAALPHHRLAAKENGVWELGSPAPAQFAVVSSIVDYVAWIGRYFTDSDDRRTLFVEGMHRIELHERALLAALLDGLRAIDGVEVYWDHDDLTQRDLIVGIGFAHLEPTQAVREYEKHGVIVYERVASSLYSGRMLKSFGLAGAVRISPLHCHAPDDIARFLAITEALAAQR
ncbi:aminotransferase class V-fold PLP-dependent enzyme [Burkholderia cenocepacia]|uniref:aminotransferase class V-fold PLP-dependent enzyme n=1 Tax=Burkholderia cepacia complex TaxID=87882 RepID=UPI000F55EFF4|nr:MULTISPECIES: aminotransferase class V-fold PLP-dependent enzyme [Burkholderia cepacia complex]ELW9450155.1 aminotransferase class V-fold PLP-dependent enzyme [Burkholderia cenocepacia]MBR8486176.1 aminotransferase class V-fold PLP-dependent enzyme [Burkholderia cenocepacia]MDN7471883.1 aminotransferase class V-fold PLP-dependent enzyme [Burkholderia orbicola]MDN7501654.1 aminotransferase class V-fold PLP-dependent enzyme [Burkholderia orbicola]RQU18392.1 aminotransferase class V-fold PLP-d